MGWEYAFCNSLRPRIAKRKSEIEVRHPQIANDK